MDISTIILHVEALVFASDKPLTNLDLTELINNSFGFMEDKITLQQIESALEGIVEKYSEAFYPFEIKQSGGGWQFLTKREFHKTVAQLNGEKFLKRLSSASLETLSIIAYKHPITKGEIESIRGVNSDYSIQKLLEKELIIITGRNEELPGKPLVFATSKNFMDYFGINSADELPRIKEVLAGQAIQPTFINAEGAQHTPEIIQDHKPDDDFLSGEETTGDDDNLVAPDLEENTDDENADSENDTALVVRGNGELIEETLVVDENTEMVNPDGIIEPEENLDDEVSRRIEEDLDQDDKEIKPEN